VTSDSSPISLEPVQHPGGTETHVVPPPPARADPPAPGLTTPPRQPRLGPFLFILGIGLVSLSFLLNSYANYEVQYNLVWYIQSAVLVYGLAYVLTGVGVLCGCAGWVLEKQASSRVRGIGRTDRGARRVAGQVVVLLGGAAIASVTIYQGSVGWLDYYKIAIAFPEWFWWFSYAAEGVGALGIAAGWSVHRTSLNVG